MKAQITKYSLTALAASAVLFVANASAMAAAFVDNVQVAGAVSLDVHRAPEGSVLYLVAKGPKEGVALLAVLGGTPPKNVTVNELTTVASAFCAARFINGETISDKPLGLKIAAGNVPNFVDLPTGGWGKVIVDPLNRAVFS